MNGCNKIVNCDLCVHLCSEKISTENEKMVCSLEYCSLGFRLKPLQQCNHFMDREL